MSENKNLKAFSQTNKEFHTACSLANIKPTKRQASKWHQGRGLAFAKREEAQKTLQNESGS